MSTQTRPSYVIRRAGPQDVPAILGLRPLAGPGFTSLSASDEAIAARLETSARSFDRSVEQPGAERYVLVLQSLADGEICGMAGVRATVGENPPFFNFRVLRIAQASSVVQRRFDMDVLILVNEFSGASEVGSLFVSPEHRAGGIGRALAQTRYLMTAVEPWRFSDRLVSELRGVVDAEGRSPFWEALGRHFFKMDFSEADRLSAMSDNQFILDLMPKYPIYADLLPEAARQAIGRCHKDGEGAMRLLQWEGFQYADVVDIFDGGPNMIASRDSVRTARESKRLPLILDDKIQDGARCLIAVADMARFRCVPARAQITSEGVCVGAATIDALQARAGETVLV